MLHDPVPSQVLIKTIRQIENIYCHAKMVPMAGKIMPVIKFRQLIHQLYGGTGTSVGGMI